MINKLTLQSVINKYYLGENESVKWTIKNNKLTIPFNSANKEIIGKVVCKNFKLEDATLAIFDTKKLQNLLSITLGDILLELEKVNTTCTKLLISDPHFNLTYSLADILLIGKVGTVNEPEWDVTLPLEDEFLLNLVKAKSALADIDNMIITTELDENQTMMCKFTFGDEAGHNNKITYQMYGEINDANIKIPFNSNMFRTILNANKDLDSGTLRISSKGLMKLDFVSGDIESEYYMIRKENTSF